MPVSAVTIETGTFVSRYRDRERIQELCRSCPGYARTWACPPFAEDPFAAAGRYRYASLILLTAVTDNAGLAAMRDRLAGKLEEAERLYGGLSFRAAGGCTLCAGCTRPDGLPCRFPERLRYSPEALGFDLCAAAADLFGYKVRWSDDDSFRELAVIAAFFHDRGSGIEGALLSMLQGAEESDEKRHAEVDQDAVQDGDEGPLLSGSVDD